MFLTPSIVGRTELPSAFFLCIHIAPCCKCTRTQFRTIRRCMQELVDMPGATALSRFSPGDKIPISAWSTTFVNPSGELKLQHVCLYCTNHDVVFDTSADAFSEALTLAAIGNTANQSIQVTGVSCAGSCIP